MASRMFNLAALSGQDYPISVKGMTIITATKGLRFAYQKADLADGSKDFFWVNAPLGNQTYPTATFQFDAGVSVFTLWIRPDGDTQVNVFTDIGSNTNEIGGV